ncbi:lactate utilization protein [Alkalibaculum sp. M08DMB]|uniref:Lactate utilization protein n=2 Tax=Alkalibaculum sporogenes TaxID=2655001 RepID=A0A6A7KBI3_9FIRM|nr:lactate utilization protein [Alkalibaculum sporogenes]
MSKALIQQFEKRRFEAYYCPDKNSALKKALELIPEGTVVSHGGSESINEIGLLDAIVEGNYEYVDRKFGNTEKELKESMKKSTFCDYYLMSSNAITKKGELVNIDGYGNRVAALSFGPENVIVVVGMNKLCEDVDNAIWRTQNIASPKNTLRLNKNTPCSTTGYCGDCYGNESICSAIVITRRSWSIGRIKIILVGEELGY